MIYYAPLGGFFFHYILACVSEAICFHLPAPPKAQTGLKKKKNPHPCISHWIHFTFPQYFVIIKPLTSKHAPTFKVKPRFFLLLPRAQSQSGADKRHWVPAARTSTGTVCSLKSEVDSPCSPQKPWTIYRQWHNRPCPAASINTGWYRVTAKSSAGAGGAIKILERGNLTVMDRWHL